MALNHPLPNDSPLSRVDWAGVAQAVTLAVVMCLCYWPTLDGGFLWDDRLFIPADPSAQSLAGLRDIWFSAKPFDYYPLTYSAFWLEWHVWGDNPLGYHVVNFLLGLLNVYLLWALLAAMRLPGAWLGALLFAVHPVNMASVAWVAETKNTLSAAFYLICLLLFLRSDETPPGQARAGWYAGALLVFLLAALSKSSVVMLPCVLLLLAWRKRGGIRRTDVMKSTPFFAVSLAAGLLTIWFHHHRAMDPNDPQAALPFLTRLLIAGRAILFYIGKALGPVQLSMIYPRWEIKPPSLADCAPLLVVAGLAFAVWKYRERWGRGPATGFAYFVLTLLPVSGLLPAALFKYSFVFDHLTYLAMMGAAAGLAALLMRWRLAGGGSSGILALAAATLATGLLALGSLSRAQDFHSPEALWRATLAVNPRCGAAHNNLGIALLEKGSLADAKAHFGAALAADPHDPLAASNLAGALQRQGAWSESAAAYAAALARTPDAKDFNNYGVVLLQLGDAAQAREQFRRSIEMEPRMLSPHFNLYKIALSQHDLPNAVEEIDACLQLDPNDVPSLLALAVLDLQAAPPGVTPPAALALTNRACRLTGRRDPVSLAILSRADRSAPVSNLPFRQPEAAARIENIASRLPSL